MELYPLTKPQQSIWNMEQYFGDSVANVTGATFFRVPVEVSDLQVALDKTVEQCDSIRIRVQIQNGTPMQFISEYEHRSFEVIIFNTTEEYDSWLSALARTPFSLDGDLFKFFIVTVGGQIGFVFYLHHLTADAWTTSLLIDTVVKNLKGWVGNTNSYLDYLAAEREYEASPRREKDKAYFLSCFERCSEPTYLYDRQAKKANAEHISLIIGKEDTAKIQVFCAENNISPYTLFMNALAMYIYRIKGAKDLYIGTAVINRSGFKEKNTAGMFVNTVPVLLNVDEDKNVLEGLHESATAILGVFRHQKYQYSDMLKDIREKHGFTDSLYDAVLSYQNAVLPDGMTAQWAFCGFQGELLNIHINDREHEDVYHLDYTYQTELYARRDIERLHEHWSNLIFDIINNPGKKPQELNLLSDNEYRKVVFDFNDTAIDYPKDKCIHQLYEEQAVRIPDAVGVVFEDKQYTYRQINEMANSLARVLRDKGIGRNDIVAIIAKRSYKIIVAQLAILKAGGAFLPIDPDYPKERIDFMLGDAGCKVALTLGAAVNGVDMEDDGLFCDVSSAVENINSSDDLCYLIYTSGSTGTPKGTMLTHRNFGNFLNNNNNNVQCTIANNCKSFFGIGAFVFDMASAEVYLALLNNHTLVLASDSQLQNPKELARLIDTYDVDFILTVPTRMLSYLSDNAFTNAVKKLKVISLGGETLTHEIVSKLKSYANAIILNGYGPAETTQGCSWTTVDGDISIGKPIANTQIYILDIHHNPMPIGAVGELCISGDGVGRGYLNNPTLTSEKFVYNPFIDGKLMYKSGDLACWREDGRIEYIGRVDNQVKIRGLRLELGEIETVIAKFNGVKHIAVVDKKDENGRQYICAYYISDGTINEKALRTELALTLPRYMIPHYFTRVDIFPTTSSGKTDNNALPSPDFTKSRFNEEYVAPVTEQEKAFVQILETVLGISPVGMDDDFFDLGGDSLKAIEFVAKAQHEGFHFPLQDVFDHATAALLLKRIAEGNHKTKEYKTEDFLAINQLLMNNKIINGAAVPVKQSLSDVLITGATGWLGVHVLDEFLSAEPGVAYCLVRGINQEDSQHRLNKVLEYYFGNKYVNCTRIVVLSGDITENIVFDKPLNTIIHCAANVKHYGSYQYSRAANVGGTKNIIALASARGAKLIHISTASVSGNSFEQSPGFSYTVFDETKLYIGQPLENVYIRSKFESEAAVLQAKLDGLNAVIIRIGNLSNRHSDLTFQHNYRENATLTRLKAFVNLGLFPFQMARFPIEFSPVDDTARAIVKLAQHFDGGHSVYHAYNHKPIRFVDFVKAARTQGIIMKTVTTKRFVQAVREAGRSLGNARVEEAFIHDIGTDGKLKYQSKITLNNSFTTRYLSKLGFDWPDVDNQYLQKYVSYFQKIKYWSVEQ